MYYLRITASGGSNCTYADARAEVVKPNTPPRNHGTA
jgi:hypothetical protein